LAGSLQPEEEEEDSSGAHHPRSPVFKLSFNHPREKERKKEIEKKRKKEIVSIDQAVIDRGHQSPVTLLWVLQPPGAVGL